MSNTGKLIESAIILDDYAKSHSMIDSKDLFYVAIDYREGYKRLLKCLKECLGPCGESRSDLIERTLREEGEIK